MAKANSAYGEWDFAKFWQEMKLPGVEFDAVVAAQQKNLQAFSTAGRIAAQGVQELAARQADMLRDGFEKTAAAAQEFAVIEQPSDRVARQTAFAKDAMELGLANARELATLWNKATTDSFEVFHRRMTESFDEMAAFVSAVTPKAPAPSATTTKKQAA